jgi:hypothetical protein
VKKGPYTHYIQLGAGENGDKPKRVTLPRGMEPGAVTLDVALKLLRCRARSAATRHRRDDHRRYQFGPT